MLENLPARITISRNRGGTPEREARPVHIVIECESSHCEVIDIALSLEEFASALTGQGHVPCLIESLNDSGLVGKIREHKTEVVEFDRSSDYGSSYKRDKVAKEAAKSALAPFEVDGWQGRIGDLFNSHNWTADPKTGENSTSHYRVVFERWVDSR